MCRCQLSSNKPWQRNQLAINWFCNYGVGDRRIFPISWVAFVLTTRVAISGMSATAVTDGSTRVIVALRYLRG